jgi:chromosome segregation ATPase
VRGTYGPEWRIYEAEIARLTEPDPDTALVVDPLGKLGGNEFRASVALLFQETGGLQREVNDQSRHLATALESLERIGAAVGGATEQLEGLRAQNQDLQRLLAESAHAHQREGQELQVSLQALAARLHEEREAVDALREALEASLRPRPTWWQRLLGRGTPSP